MHNYMLFILIFGINSVQCEPPGISEPSTFSIVIDKNAQLQDFVQIKNPPTVISGDRTKLLVEYRCTDNRYVGVELVSDITNIYTDLSVKVLRFKWRCHRNDDITLTKVRKIRLELPDTLAFNYNALNKNISFTARSSLRAWVLDQDWWEHCREPMNCFSRSLVKVTYDTSIQEPFLRPFKTSACRSWGWDAMYYATSFSVPVCPVEQEIVHMINFPVALTASHYGVFRKLKPFNNPVLEARRHGSSTRPRFTISLWMYILDYCPENATDNLCSVFHHFNWNGGFRSMILFLTTDGKFHIQVEHTDGKQTAGLTNFKAKLHEWIWVIVAFNVNKWTVTMKYGKNFDEFVATFYRHPSVPVFYDDTIGLFAFGGSEFRNSFRGYIGQATLYRNRALNADQVPGASSYHPMFELQLTRREEKCSDYITWVINKFLVYRDRYEQQRDDSVICRWPFLELIRSEKRNKRLSVCDVSAYKHSKSRKQANAMLKKMARFLDRVDFETLADRLYKYASAKLDESIHNIPDMFPVLKQAACCGSLDAMYVVAVILNNGLFVKADNIQSQAYLMMAALEKHRLSALALGHKHRYGLDGVTLDWEQSYHYHKFVADTTRKDKEIHLDTDVYTESVRLTDEAALHEQTDENGDIFHWLTHQAKQGVLSAQVRVARALYWGNQGLKRNLVAAAEYFKMGAETGDAQSQFDYGIALLKGQGTKKDVDAAFVQIRKAAEKRNPDALHALGWHALTKEKDIPKAVQYYERAQRLGSPDAAYNLGILYLSGQYPNKSKDEDKALEYFFRAGKAGQIDAGVAIAYQTIKGTGRQPRDVYTAVEWARFIAEKNPVIGLLLHKAVQAYRNGKRDVSLYYYTLAADAGLEIASFNMAWLCEANENGITSFMEKECVWSKYNMSIQRERQFVDTYALIKMGDYYWYGCQGERDVTMAAKMYAEAAKKNDPQALFNLGFMVEEGITVPKSVLNNIWVPHSEQQNNVTLLKHFYSRCRSSSKSEAYLPCSLALWRLQLFQFWDQNQSFIKLGSFALFGLMSVVSSFLMFRPHVLPEVADTIGAI